MDIKEVMAELYRLFTDVDDNEFAMFSLGYIKEAIDAVIERYGD